MQQIYTGMGCLCALALLGLVGCGDDASADVGDSSDNVGDATTGAGGRPATVPHVPWADDAGSCSEEGAPVLVEHSLSLWPPNHKFHEIAVDACVSAVDTCGRPLYGEFIWGSSDEPVDAKGDGHHAPDILLGEDCSRVSVRSERQGPSDGRVYKLGVRVVDASGNAVEGVCTIVVDHDQRGVTGADSGEAYRLSFDDVADGGAGCDGEPDEPPPGEPPPPAQEEPGEPPSDPS
jgi:hypothetical protein